MPLDEFGGPVVIAAPQPTTNVIIGYDDDGRPIYGVNTTGTNTSDISTEDQASNLELNLLRQVQDRADFIQQVWRNNYLGCELNVLAEMDADAKDVIDIPTISAIASGSISSSFASASNLVSQFQAKNCIANACNFTSRLALEEAKSKSYAIMSDLNYESEHVDLINADRLNTRMAMINPGRNGVTQAMNSLVAASRMQSELKAAAAANAGGNGLIAGRVFSALKEGASLLEKSGLFKTEPSAQGIPSRDDSLRGQRDYGSDIPNFNSDDYVSASTDNGLYLTDDNNLLYPSAPDIPIDIPIDGII